MEERWYRADFSAQHNGKELQPDSEYYVADNNEQAISIGKEIAEMGKDYADLGHVKMELTYVALVDADTEFFNELDVIYY